MGDRLTPEKAIEAVRRYREKGWVVFPLPAGAKKPDKEDGWQRSAATVTDSNVPELWKDGQNVGLILGPSGIVDVDLDCEGAVLASEVFLPRTPFAFRRDDPGSAHRVFACRGATFRDYTSGKLHVGERRAENHFTVFPPSVHPTGQKLRHDPRGGYPLPGWPEEVLPEHLYRASDPTMASGLMIQVWPGENEGRNQATGALVGGLYREVMAGRIEKELADRIATCVVEQEGRRSWIQRAQDPSDLHALGDLWKKLQANAAAGAGGRTRRVPGWKTLEGCVGKEHVDSFREWLDIGPQRRTRAPSPLAAAPFADELVWLAGSNPPQPSPTEQNVVSILRHDDVFRDDEGRPVIFYDQRTMELMIAADVWADLNGNADALGQPYPRRLWSDDHTELKTYLERSWGLVVPMETVRNALDVFKKTAPRNVLRERLEDLGRAHDPTKTHLRNFFGECVVVEKPDDVDEAAWAQYLWACTRMIFVAAVARTFHPGVRADCMVILEGEQGIEKSALCRAIAFGDPHSADASSYYASFGRSLSNPTKDDMAGLIGKVIVEFSELTSMRKSEVEDLKKWLSDTTFEFRKAYRRDEKPYARTDVAIGTVNPGADGYLADVTGGRRFWPVKVVRIDMARFLQLRDAIWAEAVVLYRQGVAWWPSRDEHAIGAVQQDARMERGSWSDVLADHLGDREGTIRHADVARLLGIPVKECRGHVSREITRAMRAIGWMHHRNRATGTLATVYEKGAADIIYTVTAGRDGSPGIAEDYASGVPERRGPDDDAVPF